ncbi:MAG: tetratricopeptide repeat protein, partial [Cyanobacteria bacterium J06592_8]
SLTDIQMQILKQALTGKKLKDIQVNGYSETTVQRIFCPKLWQLLSKTLKQKVTIKTLRLILEKQLKNTAISTQIYPEKLNPATQQVLHNLPATTCTQFIGRTPELTRLLELLSSSHAAHLISVDGIGGVGKTTLVLEACYRCLRASQNQSKSSVTPEFDAIIFTSAKELRLTSMGLLNSLYPHRTLTDIFRQISRVIPELSLAGMSFTEQLESIQDTLAQYRTLLVIDNLETVTEPEEILAFLYELPLTVKTIITTREQIIFVPVRLTALSEVDGLALIQHEAQEKGVQLELCDRLQLYQKTGGIPVAIHYAMGQLASGYSIAEVLQQLQQSTGDVAQFCFAHSVQPLRGKPAHFVLMALTFFPASALPSALVSVAIPNANQDRIQQAFSRLRGLSLVQKQASRYSLLPLTREYALAELNANLNFEKEARHHWLNWYLQFSATHRQTDIDEWSGHGFEELTSEWENLQAVMEWCITQNYYTKALQLWQNLETYTQFRGRNISRLEYWSDRLVWTTALMQMAQQRGDWLVLTQISLDRAWTLCAIAKPPLLLEAEKLLQQTWDLRHHQEVLFQAKLARSLGINYCLQSRFEDAELWFNQADELLKKFPQFENLEYKRLAARLLCDFGRILVQGGDYEQAKQKYTQSLELAYQLNWVRQISIVQCCLADIAISQGQLDEAQLLLKDGLYLAEVNCDRTHLAYFQRTLAKLAQARGDTSEALHWGKLALETFDALGMELEAQSTQNLLDTFS